MSVFVGEQVQSGFGDWTGNPTKYTYQWQDSANGTTGWGNLSGETRSDYIVLVGELTKYLRCQVTATNAGGNSTVSNSAVVGPVGVALLVPVKTVAPAVTGTAAVAHTLTGTTGAWTNTPTSYARQWQSSSSGIGGWTTIPGATSSTYVIDVTYLNFYVRERVVATNADGDSQPAFSAAVGPVASSSVSSLLLIGAQRSIDNVTNNPRDVD